MDKITLHAQPRTAKGKANAALRDKGLTPAVVYGHGVASEALQIEAKQLEKVYAQAGGNKLVQLKVGDKAATNVLIHDIVHDWRGTGLLHADLLAIKMNEAIETEVPIHFIGESTAVYQDEGVLLKNLEMISVKALPAALPESLEVDISVLDDFDKTIHVSDIKVPAGVEILADAEELVARVEPPRSDEEMAELDEAVDEALPEGVAEDSVVISEESGGNNDREPKPDKK